MAEKVKNEVTHRSLCPMSCTLDLIGDRWSILIVRDMLLFNKCTYNEFLNSHEKIATNILNDRLKMLLEVGIIEYTGTLKRKKYRLSEMGLDLKPILEATAKFGMKHFEGSAEFAKEQFKLRGQKLPSEVAG